MTSEKYASGTLVKCIFKNGASAFTIDRERFAFSVAKKEVAVVIYDTDDGWLFILSKRGLCWARHRSFSNDV